jgi:hypothetical protein
MNSQQLETTVNVIQHMAEQWQLELQWARSLRKKEVLQAEAQEFEIPDLQM